MNPPQTQVGGDHYAKLKIQPVEYIHANGLGFIEGSVIKYVTRHKSKNGKQDIEKAIHFLELLMEMEYGVSAKKNEAMVESKRIETCQARFVAVVFLDGKWLAQGFWHHGDAEIGERSYWLILGNASHCPQCRNVAIECNVALDGKA